MDSDISIQIRERDCIGCELCVRICPAGVLEVVDGQVSVSHPELCTVCRLCENKCKFGLITVDAPTHRETEFSAITEARKEEPEVPELTCLNIHVTQQCNLRCVHCFADGGKRFKDEITLQDARNALIQALQLGLRSLTLTGGGEPLLRREFCYEITRLASSLGVHVRLCTNGTLVTQDVALALKDRGIGIVQVSLDSADSRVHDALRGRAGVFNQVIRAIEVLVHRSIPVMVRATLTSRNHDQLDQLLDLCIDLGVSSFRVAPLRPIGRGASVKEWFPSPDQLREAITHLVELRQSLRGKLAIATDECYAHLVFPAPKVKPPTQLGCRAGVDKIVVAPNGLILPCDTFDLPVGNIRSDSLIDIWRNHEVIRQLRTIDHIKGKCGACEYLNICGGGCRAVAYALHRDIYAEDSMCWYSYA